MLPKHDGIQNSVFIQYSHTPYWQKAVTTHLHLTIIYIWSSFILIVLFFPACGTDGYIRRAPLFLPLYLVIFSCVVHTSCTVILRCVVHFSSAPFRAATPAVLLSHCCWFCNSRGFGGGISVPSAFDVLPAIIRITEDTHTHTHTGGFPGLMGESLLCRTRSYLLSRFIWESRAADGVHGGGETKSAGDNEMQSGRRVRLKLSRRGCVSVCLWMSADLPQQAASPFSLYFSLITYFIQITLSATGSCLLEEQRDTIKEKEKKLNCG